MCCVSGWEGKTAYKILLRMPRRELQLAKTGRLESKIKLDLSEKGS